MKHEIKLYGPIDSWWNSAEEIIGAIPKDATEIEMRIHSPGGSVGEGLAMYHALRDHPAHVVTIVDGYAASTASFLMLAGDERRVHRNSLVFVHNPWTYAEGDADSLRKSADNLDVHADAILDIYKQRTGMSEDDLRDMMDETAFFRGVDAKENGFATEIIDNEEAENRIAAMLELSAFAALTKETQMSTKKTRKEIEAEAAVQAQELETAHTEISALTEAHAKAIEDAKAEHESAITAEQDKSTSIQAELDTATASIAEFTAQVDDLTEARDTISAELEEVKTSSAAQATELKEAKAALANPAIADAVLKDTADAPQAALDAEADDAEAKAKAKDEAEAPKDIMEEYERMPAGEDRREFWNTNKRAILACANERGE